jgi:hypothetical protein
MDKPSLLPTDRPQWTRCKGAERERYLRSVDDGQFSTASTATLPTTVRERLRPLLSRGWAGGILWKVPVDCRGKSNGVTYCPNQTQAYSRNLYYLLSLNHCRQLSSLPTTLIERLGCRSKHSFLYSTTDNEHNCPACPHPFQLKSAGTHTGNIMKTPFHTTE